MPKILNLVIQDRCDPRDVTEFVESFKIRDDVLQPEKALRDAVKEFVNSGTDESKQAIVSSNGCFNWGDAVTVIPDSLFTKHGLTRLYGETIDVFVDHNEVLCDLSPDELPYDNQMLILIKIKQLINENIINGKKDIDYWQRGSNLFAENVADEIAERNNKLKKLLVMETITVDLVKNLIETEKDDELIAIYEEIFDELTSSGETGDEY